MEKIIQLDRELLVYLNSLGSEAFDAFWIQITHTTSWIPFFLLLIVVIYKKYGLRNTAFLLLTVAIMITLVDQTTNWVKYTTQRLRPCNDPYLKTIIRLVQTRDSFSYFSGHASNSSAVITLVFLLLKPYYKYSFLLYIYPLLFAYSRIYLGLHFPLDILSGYLFGILNGYFFYKLYQTFLCKKIT